MSSPTRASVGGDAHAHQWRASFKAQLEELEALQQHQQAPPRLSSASPTTQQLNGRSKENCDAAPSSSSPMRCSVGISFEDSQQQDEEEEQMSPLKMARRSRRLTLMLQQQHQQNQQQQQQPISPTVTAEENEQPQQQQDLFPVLRRFRSVAEIRALSSKQLNECLRDLHRAIDSSSSSEQQNQQQQEQRAATTVFPPIHSAKVVAVVALLKRCGVELPAVVPKTAQQPQQQVLLRTGATSASMTSNTSNDVHFTKPSNYSYLYTHKQQQQQPQQPQPQPQPAMKFGGHHRVAATPAASAPLIALPAPRIAGQRRQRHEQLPETTTTTGADTSRDSNNKSVAFSISTDGFTASTAPTPAYASPKSSLKMGAAAASAATGAREIFDRVKAAAGDGTIATLPLSDIDFFLSRALLRQQGRGGSVAGAAAMPRLKKDKCAMCIEFVESGAGVL